MRKKNKSKLEKKVEDCPNIFRCYGAEWEWNCFNNYGRCVRYRTGNLTLPVATYEQWERNRERAYNKKN